MTDDEKQRIADCVNAFHGIANPKALGALLEAICSVFDALERGDRLEIGHPAIEQVRTALAALDIQPEIDEN